MPVYNPYLYIFFISLTSVFYLLQAVYLHCSVIRPLSQHKPFSSSYAIRFSSLPLFIYHFPDLRVLATIVYLQYRIIERLRNTTPSLTVCHPYRNTQHLLHWAASIITVQLTHSSVIPNGISQLVHSYPRYLTHTAHLYDCWGGSTSSSCLIVCILHTVLIIKGSIPWIFHSQHLSSLSQGVV